MDLTPKQNEEIAERAAKSAAEAASLSATDLRLLAAEVVKQTLTQIGVDQSNPIEMQADFQHLRSWRKAGQELKTKGMVALLGLFLSGLGGLIVIGLKGWFSSPGKP